MRTVFIKQIRRVIMDLMSSSRVYVILSKSFVIVRGGVGQVMSVTLIGLRVPLSWVTRTTYECHVDILCVSLGYLMSHIQTIQIFFQTSTSKTHCSEIIHFCQRQTSFESSDLFRWLRGYICVTLSAHSLKKSSSNQREYLNVQVSDLKNYPKHCWLCLEGRGIWNLGARCTVCSYDLLITWMFGHVIFGHVIVSVAFLTKGRLCSFKFNRF